MPILRQQVVQQDQRPRGSAGRNARVDIPSAPMPQPEMRPSVHVGAEGGGQDESGGTRASDRATDAFFRADYHRVRRERVRSGLTYSLDDYKREFGILFLDGTETGAGGGWQGTITDPFARRVGYEDEDGDRLARVISLEDAGIIE